MNRQFKELADVHLEDGSPVEAIHCLRQNFVDSSTVDRSRSIVSTYLWANFGLDAAPDTKSTEQAAELITISRSPVLPSGLVNHSERHDVSTPDSLVGYLLTVFIRLSYLMQFSASRRLGYLLICFKMHFMIWIKLMKKMKLE